MTLTLTEATEQVRQMGVLAGRAALDKTAAGWGVFPGEMADAEIVDRVQHPEDYDLASDLQATGGGYWIVGGEFTGRTAPF